MTAPTVATGMADTMQEKDLVEGESFSEYRNRTGNVESEEEEVKSESNDINVKQEYKEGSFEFSSSEKDGVTSTSEKMEGVTRFDMKTGKAYIFGQEVSTDDYMEYINTPRLERQSKIKEILSRYEVNKVEPLKENVNIQVQKQDKDLSLLDDTNARVDRIVQSTTDAGNIDQNQGVIVPRNTSQTSEATIKLAKSDVKFVQLTANPYISISPTSKGLPPEVLRRLT